MDIFIKASDTIFNNNLISKKKNKAIYQYRPSVISIIVTKGGYLEGSRLYKTSKTIGRGVSQITQGIQYIHKVKTWECHILRTLNILIYRISTYSVITIGRRYIFKYTTPTVK